MMAMMGARNVSGFTNSLKAGLLPPHTHLTYEGLFNEIKYNVGPKTNKVLDLHYGYSRFQFVDSQQDNSINDYLALFLKGKADGEDRDEGTKLNLVICLDISGSMSGGLGGVANNNQHRSRLQLSIEAIKMLIGKLKPNDSIGMVTFNNSAQVIFEPMLKKNLSSQIYERLDEIRSCGGTTIINGFTKSNELLEKWIKSHEGDKCQNRVIMLTDVCDEGISQQGPIIEQAANQHHIHTSIIGISTDFQSSACEAFKEIKGFNYFCAVNQEDIQKYVFETFDFGFFPSASNVNLDIQSDDIAGIEVFGTPDSDKVEQYRKEAKGNYWTVTKVKSCFPSEIQIHGDTVYTVGGLILVKIKRPQKGSTFNGQVYLKYDDPDGKTHIQNYDIHFEFHPDQQFFSGDELREAIEGYVFTSELKKILKDSADLEGKEIYNKYWKMLKAVETLCPKQKAKQFEDIKNIVSKYENKQEAKSKETVK